MTRFAFRAQKKTVVYVYFDGECTQDTSVTLPSGRQVQRHVCNLIMVEILCEPCRRAGITTADEDSERTAGEICRCGLPKRGRRSRKLRFDNFDNFNKDVVWSFLEFLLYSGPKDTTKIAIAHNAGKPSPLFHAHSSL